MIFMVGVLEFSSWHFKRVLTKIVFMGMSNDVNEMCMISVDGKVDDVKYYVST